MSRGKNCKQRYVNKCQSSSEESCESESSRDSYCSDRSRSSDDCHRRTRHNHRDNCNEKKCIVKKYYTTNNNTGDVINSATLAYSDFYGLMPGDNSTTVAAGTPVQFPQDGPTNGVITRLDAMTFNLKNIGTYEILFQVSVTEAGQLVIGLNSGTGFQEVPNSVVGRATGMCQIVGMSLINTTVANTQLEIMNPSGNTPALTITPFAGGESSVSCHLVIKQLA